MKYLLRSVLIALVALSIYSFKKSRELPFYEKFVDVAQSDPVQEPTQQPTFSAEVDGHSYTITPLRTYRIAGMVVSCGFSKALSEYYKDGLNIMDAGLVWGSNLDPEIYRNIKFHTNGVRLFYHTKDREAYERFDESRVSNNHLLCIDPDLKKRIKALKRGDVVSIKGLLVSYLGRKSSLTRTDQGDGACEVVWVDEMELLQDGTRHWHSLFKGGLYGIGALLMGQVAWFFIRPIESIR